MNRSFQKLLFLKKSFNISELEDICRELNIDPENMSWDNKPALARELIGYLERRERLNELDKILLRERPKVRMELGVQEGVSTYEYLEDVKKQRSDFILAIKQDEIDKALSIISEIIDNNQLEIDSFIGLVGRWNSEKQDYRKGIVDREKFTLAKNQFREDLLNFWKQYFG